MQARPLLGVLAFLVIVIGGVGAIYAYDSAHSDTIGKGVTVGGVDISGLTVPEARSRLRREYLPTLHKRVVVTYHGRRWTLSPREAKVHADLGATVQEALDRSQGGNIVSRSFRHLTGGSLHADLAPDVSYSRSAVRHLVAQVAGGVDRKVQEADVSFDSGQPHIVRGQAGRELRRARLKRGVRNALLASGPRRIRARAAVVEPHRTTKEVAARYPTIVTVNRSGFRLTLYKHLKPVKSYPIAVGMAGLETPAGLYHIQDKQVNPSWHVPNSAWAGSMAGQVIPPGPQDPIKARWMGIYNGAGIHGTDETYSLGTAGSHGCIRMAIPDVEALYDRVSVGTPVYIG